MKKIFQAALIGVPLVLSACSVQPVPVASSLTHFDQDTKSQKFRDQEKVLAGAQWQALARDVGGKIKEMAAKIDDQSASYFVEPLDPRVPFAKAFRTHLISSLMDNGLPVSMTRTDSYRVHYDMQIIDHAAGINNVPSGAYTIGTGLGYLVNKVSQNWYGNWYLAGIAGAAIVLDAANGSSLELLDEMALTVSLVRDTELYGQVTALYYIDGSEMHQYAGAAPAAPLTMAASSEQQAPLRVRQIPIVSE